MMMVIPCLRWILLASFLIINSRCNVYPYSPATDLQQPKNQNHHRGTEREQSTNTRKQQQINAIRTNNHQRQPLLPPHEEIISISRHRKHAPEKEQKNGNNYKRKTAIIHIGPHKTGTSSIQGNIKVLIPYLLQDNIELPLDPTQNGIIHMGGIRNCFCPSCETMKDKNLTCNMEQVEVIKDISKRGSNIIISAETFSFRTTDISSFKSFLEPLFEDVIIIVYYRRFYDWLFSQWNELFKNKPVDRRLTFSQWMIDIPTIQKKFERNHYTYSTVQRWRHHFGTSLVRVYNMHDTEAGTVSEQFFCTAIQLAPTTCKIFKELQMKQGNTVYNKARNFVYEEMAFYAIKLGYITFSSSEYDLIHLTEFIRKKIPNISTDVEIQNSTSITMKVMHCLDEERLQFLYDKTIEAERYFFPNYYKRIGKNEIDEKFQVDRYNKLCYLNATEILLSNPLKWKQFFQEFVSS